MRFLKGKSPRKELNFEIFRAAGAPILEFFDHNPKFVKKGGYPTPPPIFRADLAGFGQKGGSDTFNCPDVHYRALVNKLP